MQAFHSGRLPSRPGEKRCHETPAQISGGKWWILPARDMVLYCTFQVFHVTSDFVELNPAFRDFDERTSKVDQVMKQLRAENVFLTLKGWRNEV